MIKPSKELYEIAVDCADEAYNSKKAVQADDGTTEFKISDRMLQVGEEADWIKVLAIAGTNEELTLKNAWNFIKEWWKNIDLRSKNKIKKAGVDAMNEIYFSGKLNLEKDDKLLITVHSKSGPTGVAFADKYRENNNVYVVAFAPARSLRHRGINRHFKHMTIFVDPDDFVHQLGFISFAQPICRTYKLPNDHIGKNIKDHGLKNFKKFIKSMVF